MFGCPCAFVAGNMFSGLFQDRAMLRLPPDEREKFLALPGAAPFEPMPGRVMKEYAVVPKAIVSDRAALRRWLRKAFDYAASLPVKRKRGGRR